MREGLKPFLIASAIGIMVFITQRIINSIFYAPIIWGREQWEALGLGSKMQGRIFGFEPLATPVNSSFSIFSGDIRDAIWPESLAFRLGSFIALMFICFAILVFVSRDKSRGASLSFLGWLLITIGVISNGLEIMIFRQVTDFIVVPPGMIISLGDFSSVIGIFLVLLGAGFRFGEFLEKKLFP